jgi:hypothetical protein
VSPRLRSAHGTPHALALALASRAAHPPYNRAPPARTPHPTRSPVSLSAPCTPASPQVRYPAHLPCLPASASGGPPSGATFTAILAANQRSQEVRADEVALYHKG